MIGNATIYLDNGLHFINDLELLLKVVRGRESAAQDG